MSDIWFSQDIKLKLSNRVLIGCSHRYREVDYRINDRLFYISNVYAYVPYERTWVIMDASEVRLRIVSAVFNLMRIGISISSAELSKNDMTVLSAVRKTVSNISPLILG